MRNRVIPSGCTFKASIHLEWNLGNEAAFWSAKVRASKANVPSVTGFCLKVQVLQGTDLEHRGDISYPNSIHLSCTAHLFKRASSHSRQWWLPSPLETKTQTVWAAVLPARCCQRCVNIHQCLTGQRREQKRNHFFSLTWTLTAFSILTSHFNYKNTWRDFH